MNDIPIFDCLTHPTIDGSWISEKYGKSNSLENLLMQMKNANVKWAFAVGMGRGIGGYEEGLYAQYIFESKGNVFPIALVDYSDIPDVSGMSAIQIYIEKITKLGYRGIKIHPRFSGIAYNDKRNAELIKTAHSNGLIAMICTYPYQSSPLFLQNTTENLFKLLMDIGDSRLILLHGGAVQLMHVCEIARHFPNVLLDLSFTICKYAKSSIDADIAYLFNSFDRRICIGSDSPEFSLMELRSRYEFFSADISEEKKINIAYKNLLELTGQSYEISTRK